MCLKHLRNTRKNLKTTCVAIANIAKVQMKPLATYVYEKHLKHLYIYAASRSTFATSRLNTCNIRLKQMKHFEPILETYVHRHCNMCNIPIYFCNIDVKHLQHTLETSETLKTYVCNMRFPAQYHLAAWTNGGSSLRSSTSVWRSAAAPGARRCPSGGTAMGEHPREATGAALGEHLREEQLESTAACSPSTPYSTLGKWPAADEHPLLGKHEQDSW